MAQEEGITQEDEGTTSRELAGQVKKNTRNIIIASSVAIVAGLFLGLGGAYLYYTHKNSGGDLDETEVSFEI